ncbi:MAG: ATP-binding protein [Deltaproteobacteria bacterium]|nr:ATP-binding protein [Deltaproteobacteria bacterium]
MIERQLFKWLELQRERPQICQLYGLRQTGKTTLMRAFLERLENAHLYSLQDLVALRRYERDPESWVFEVEDLLRASKDKTLNILVDEIQKIAELFQAIQGLYDEHKGRIKFWIWGSSARAVKRKRAETLAGRIVSKTLWPLAQAEIFSSSSLVGEILKLDATCLSRPKPRGYLQIVADKFLTQSLLPEPYQEVEQGHAFDLLEGYQATYLESEIRRENIVSDIGVFEKFLALAAYFDGGIVNYSTLASQLGVSYNTVKSYYGILADTFVLTVLPAYSLSLRVQQVKSPKIYFSDTGLARFVSGKRHVPSISTPEFGLAFEGFVINEIRKQIEYSGLPWSLFYLRTKQGREVDLVVKSTERTVAIEIKAKEKLTGSDTENLRYFLEHEKNFSYAIVISLMPGCVKLAENIYNLPAWML